MAAMKWRTTGGRTSAPEESGPTLPSPSRLLRLLPREPLVLVLVRDDQRDPLVEDNETLRLN
eukprot:10227224-Alexandrium_andersonii.AAC.1